MNTFEKFIYKIIYSCMIELYTRVFSQ